jgi:acetate kinase
MGEECRMRVLDQRGGEGEGRSQVSGVLVLNTGSSSIKYRLFDMDSRAELAAGRLERIGERASGVADHEEGLRKIFGTLEGSGGLGGGLAGIGHRVVHGGERFSEPALIDDAVVEAIREQVPLAPLHNPANLLGIQAARSAFPGTPQVAVFDTAFHRTMPPHAFSYAIPRDLAGRLRIRRYGFHGTSHAHVSRKAAEHLGRPLGDVNLITMHLGNGASVAAVAGGRSVDTSMGLTPLEGLVMGTRSGDIDPAIVFHLHREASLPLDEIDRLLNDESGLKGLSGVNDMREIERRAGDGDRVAREALDVYCYRVRKYVGAYTAVLGRVDALVFTAGIGENSAAVRAGVCGGLERLGARLDQDRNRARSRGARTVSAEDSPTSVLVVPTNEELEIAEQTLTVIAGRQGR